MRRLLVLLFALALTTTAWAADQPVRRVIYFASWSADIDDTATHSIDDAATWAKTNPHGTLQVVGYASTVGSKRANALLSDLRAQVVVDQLHDKGVASTRIKLVPKGATTYVDSPLESRRVEIVLVNGK